jgi:glycosyltransferase involved in cell wall biosynthesis
MRSAHVHLQMLDQITPVLLAYNEEQNISRTLSHLAWAKDIVVVDSASTDGTLAASSQLIAQKPR